MDATTHALLSALGTLVAAGVARRLAAGTDVAADGDVHTQGAVS